MDEDLVPCKVLSGFMFIFLNILQPRMVLGWISFIPLPNSD